MAAAVSLPVNSFNVQGDNAIPKKWAKTPQQRLNGSSRRSCEQWGAELLLLAGTRRVIVYCGAHNHPGAAGHLPYVKEQPNFNLLLCFPRESVLSPDELCLIKYSS